MSKTKKMVIIVLVSLLLLTQITVSQFVSIDGEPWMAGGAVCISFDKWDMMRADRLVVGYRGKTYTITERELVRAFSKETLAGTYSDYCCAGLNEGWVEVYRGDRLLRRMRYVGNHNAIAYEADDTHWVLYGEEGHAFLSNDTWNKLYAIIGAK